MKYIILILLIAVLCSCENIRHKTFRVVSSGAGGKMSVVDPTGSGNIAPVVIIGAYTSTVTTIPIGSKAKYTTKSYELFSGKLLFEESMEIETVSGNIKITDESVDVSE